MEIQEVPIPEIGERDVLLRICSVGVCGSDIHYYSKGRIGVQVVEYPFAVGHECSGIVDRVGSAVTSLKKGDRVAVDPAMPCLSCDQCLAGRSHTCRKLRFLGCPGQAEGCLSEFLAMPAHSCFPIPDSMSFEQATASEPLAIGYYTALLGAVPKRNAAVAVLGFGPIGISVLLSAKVLGISRIYVTDKQAYRVELAKRLGADWAGNPDTCDIVREISKIEPLQLDAVYECCGEQEAVDQGIELLKPGGRLVIVGIPTVDSLTFRIDLMRRKELVLQNVRRQNECTRKALDLIIDGSIDVNSMITHRFPFEKTGEAFELVDGYRDGVVKAMIEFC
jgi:L-iditol 2-dehydrogenase